MPAPGRSKAIFRAALDGDVLTAADIEGLVREHVPEDQWLEYKQHWTDPKEAARELRRHVTGFANAEGGLLLIGVEAGESTPPAWAIHGFRDGDRNAARWAETTLQTVGARLNPAPRVQVVACGEKRVLAIAVDRSYALVPVNEAADVKHHLRIGDSTVEIPPYLYADLTLQRRARPHLVIKGSGQGAGHWKGGTSGAILNIVVENDGFSFVDDLCVGIMGFALGSESPHYREMPQQRVGRVGEAGKRLVERIPGGVSAEIQRCEALIVALDPLAVAERRLQLFLDHGHIGANIRVEFPPNSICMAWCGGAYIYARDCRPRWFQLDVRFNIVTPEQGSCELVELPDGARPKVYWGSLEQLIEATGE